jgi:hypothetical protein
LILAALLRTNESLPPLTKSELDDVVGEYVRAVVDHEWETMKDDEESPDAAAALEGAFADHRVVGAAQTDNYTPALAKLDEVEFTRRGVWTPPLPTCRPCCASSSLVGLVVLLVVEYRPQLSAAAGLVF